MSSKLKDRKRSRRQIKRRRHISKSDNGYKVHDTLFEFRTVDKISITVVTISVTMLAVVAQKFGLVPSWLLLLVLFLLIGLVVHSLIRSNTWAQASERAGVFTLVLLTCTATAFAYEALDRNQQEAKPQVSGALFRVAMCKSSSPEELVCGDLSPYPRAVIVLLHNSGRDSIELYPVAQQDSHPWYLVTYEDETVQLSKNELVVLKGGETRFVVIERTEPIDSPKFSTIEGTIVDAQVADCRVPAPILEVLTTIGNEWTSRQGDEYALATFSEIAMRDAPICKF